MKHLFLVFAFLFWSLTVARAAETSHPTMADMETWKQSLIAQYEKAIYLDEKSQPITEHEFFTRVVNEKRGHTITTVRGSHKLITLRLLSDAELGWTPIQK
jgi:hypothetical protein